MSLQAFTEMSEAEFDTLIDNYIEREAAGYGEMPAEVFFDLLLERSAARTRQPLPAVGAESGGDVVGDEERAIEGVPEEEA